MKTVPTHLEEIGTICYNFEGIVDRDVEKRVRDGEGSATFPGWNFYAIVWWDGQFHAEIRRYGRHVETRSADSFEEIRDIASEQYGSE